MNFNRYYAILGLQPSDGWKELRDAYRARIRACHPDRFSSRPDELQFAEEKTKALNEAYRELAAYYRAHGRLPKPANDTPDSAQPSDAKTADPLYRPPHEPHPPTSRFAFSSPRVRYWAGAFGTTFVAAAAFMLFDSDSEPMTSDSNIRSTNPDRLSARPSPTVASSPRNSFDNSPFFSVGSTPGEVYAAQGIPTSAQADIWHYGQSKVYFAKGVVTSWEESPSNPLKIHTGPALPGPERKYFGKGATKSDVRRIQGVPVREADNVWDYGVSRVYFQGDRVVGWYESPLNPLYVPR